MLSSPRTGAFVIVVFSERERFKSAEINQMPYVCNTPGITESFRPSFVLLPASSVLRTSPSGSPFVGQFIPQGKIYGRLVVIL
jgi:hypothetical protein